MFQYLKFFWNDRKEAIPTLLMLVLGSGILLVAWKSAPNLRVEEIVGVVTLGLLSIALAVTSIVFSVLAFRNESKQVEKEEEVEVVPTTLSARIGILDTFEMFDILAEIEPDQQAILGATFRMDATRASHVLPNGEANSITARIIRLAHPVYFERHMSNLGTSEHGNYLLVENFPQIREMFTGDAIRLLATLQEMEDVGSSVSETRDVALQTHRDLD